MAASDSQFKEPRKALFRSPDQDESSKSPGYYITSNPDMEGIQTVNFLKITQL